MRLDRVPGSQVRVVVASLSVAVGLMLMSCGGKQSIATPSVSHAAQPGWKTYVSARWRYAIDYPTGWYDVPSSGAPDTQKYFSNERVGAPLAMSANGVWETITIGSNQSEPCAPRPGPPYVVISQALITLDSVPTTLYVVNLTSRGTEASYLIAAGASHRGTCYVLTFLSLNSAARDANIDVAKQAIASFRFGS
jgi:hypothetical protein